MGIETLFERKQEVLELIDFWGFKNPRLFLDQSGDFYKDALVFIVNVQEDHIDYEGILEMELKRIINCPLFITLEEAVKKKYKHRLLEEAIPLTRGGDENKKIRDYFEGIELPLLFDLAKETEDRKQERERKYQSITPLREIRQNRRNANSQRSIGETTEKMKVLNLGGH